MVRVFFAVLVVLALGACDVGVEGGYPDYATAVRITAPPPPLVEIRPASPYYDAIWVPGYWDYTGSRWIWIRGQWVAPGSRVPRHYYYTHGRYYWSSRFVPPPRPYP